MQDLHLPHILTKWVQLFLSDWTVSLAFDGEKDSDQKVKSGILQGSPISPILFLIYIRFLFTQVKKQHTDSQIKIPSYIDDVAVTVEGKSAEENSIVLEKVAKSLFLWAKDNAVVFDDSKTELIHFNKDKEMAISAVTLSNNTIINSSKVIWWLEVWFDQKLTFKDHVKKKIASATWTLHLLHRLLSSEWGLSAAAGRQLYIACITFISDYGCQVWFNNQKGFLNSYQKLQNSALRKVLGAFKTSPSSAMEIEVAICPPIVRFQKTCRLYALRIACMTENHSIRQRTPITFSPEYQTGIDLDENKFLDWNETSIQTMKKHPTQLIRILHTLSDLLPNTPKLKEYSSETSLKESGLKESGLKEISFSKENLFSQNSQNSWNFKISKEDKD